VTDDGVLKLSEIEERAQAERAQKEPFRVDLEDGKDPLELPHPAALTLDRLGVFEDGRIEDNPLRAIRALIGNDEDFDYVTSRLSVGGLGVLMGDYDKHYGLDRRGERSASPRTSPGSTTRSRRTSRTSTRASA
jgi:hypothetical protein